VDRNKKSEKSVGCRFTSVGKRCYGNRLALVLSVRRRRIMTHELICSCLDLSPSRWPPDYYTLLGLERGETDARRIEEHVQERMERLRRYQLTHPEEATEGMNRLAQALVCLTDPVAKKAYDAKLLKRHATRLVRSTPLPRSSLDDPDSTPAGSFPARTSARLLLLAWIVWLSVGVVGLAAMVHYFPSIQESYVGVRQKGQKQPEAKTSGSRTTSAGHSGQWPTSLRP
jgi:hypothetical protein